MLLRSHRFQGHLKAAEARGCEEDTCCSRYSSGSVASLASSPKPLRWLIVHRANRGRKDCQKARRLSESLISTHPQKQKPGPTFENDSYPTPPSSTEVSDLCLLEVARLGVPPLILRGPLQTVIASLQGRPGERKTRRALNVSFPRQASQRAGPRLAESQRQQNSSAWNVCSIKTEHRLSLELIRRAFLLVGLRWGNHRCT